MTAEAKRCGSPGERSIAQILLEPGDDGAIGTGVDLVDIELTAATWLDGSVETRCPALGEKTRESNAPAGGCAAVR